MTTTVEELVIPDVLTETEAPSEREALRAVDRCDHSACNAQAYIAVQFESTVDGVEHAGELLFCGHHFTKYEAKLKPFVVRDDREKLLAKLMAAY